LTTTPNLGLAHIAAGQNQKEVTANAALDGLDKALTDELAVSVSGGNETVTAAELRQAIHLAISGVAVAGRTVTVPAMKRLFAATLDAVSTESVAIVRGAASFSLAPGEGGLFYADGSTDGLFRIVSGGVGGAIAIADVTGLQAELDALAADIAGKADTSHTHAQSEITNLVSDLAGKSAVGHGHAASEITGRPIAVAMFLAGTGTNGEQALRFVVPVAFSVPSGGAGSAGSARVAATSSTTYTAKKNGTSFGTFAWAAAGTAATLTIGSTTAFAAGDVLTIDGPATADATLADIAITIAGTVT
jgi:hypothetical protein